MLRQKSFDQEGAALYLVATPIGNLKEMTPRAIEVLESVDVIAAEDTRNTLKLLHHFGIKTKLIAHHQHNEEHSADGILRLLEDGKRVAIVSDAGYPLISDPGNIIVKKASDANFPVIPISGSNAMLNALVASGMNTQHFLFFGFLKQQEKERIKQLQELKHFPYTIVFYEAPHRIERMLKSCRKVLGDREVCIARELTKRHEEFIRGRISEILEIADELKGEMVVIVEGSKESYTNNHQEIDVYQCIQTYIAQGLTTKEAIKTVAKEVGISKNELYKQYHEQQA